MRFSFRGHARTPHVPGRMNKMEAAYALVLDIRQKAGEVLWWKYEGMKLRLADRTFYTPDFAVILANQELEFHEVKGSFIEDDAAVKMKVAAQDFPFSFRLVRALSKAAGGGFYLEDV